MNVFIAWLLITITAVGVTEEGLDHKAADAAASAYDTTKDAAKDAYTWSKAKLVKAD